MEHLADLYNSSYFTYFLGPEDMIFYSHGLGCHPSTKSLRAVMTYFPDKKGDRVLYKTNRTYRSTRINGFSEDLPTIKQLPPKQRDCLLDHLSNDPYTGEEIIEIPLSEITAVFDPKRSLQEFLNAPPSLAGIAQVHAQVIFAVNILLNARIPLSDLGFYGSLQCSLFHKELRNKFNDIDILVYGLEHQDKIVKIAQGHKIMDYKRLDRTDAILQKIEKRQLDLSEVHMLYEGQKTYMHLTQVRKEEDINTFPDLSKVVFNKDSCTIKGVVLDSQEGFTTPTVFDVLLDNGKHLKIINRYYYFTKAAYKGDRIAAKGFLSQGGKYLTLSDTKQHFLIVN